MNKHLAAVSLAGLTILCAALVLGGCRRSAAPTALAPADQNALLLQQIKQFQEESGKSLAWLTQEVERAKAASLEQAGDPPVVRELAVARFALRDAANATTAMDAKAMGTVLATLRQTLEIAKTELPAMQIARHVQRAVYLVRSQQAAAQSSFTAASAELQGAATAVQNGRPASAVPNVAKDLGAAKSAADRGDGEAALAALATVLQTLEADALVQGFAQAQAAIGGAQQALAGRQQPAWPVIKAEMQELDGVLASLAQTLAPKAAAPAPAPAPAAAAPSAATAPASGAATPPAEQTPAATSATPPAAATTAPAATTPPATAPEQAPPAATGQAPAPRAGETPATPPAPANGKQR